MKILLSLNIKKILIRWWAIKLLNNEYSLARTYMNYTMSLSDLSLDFQAYNMHNMAFLNTEMSRNCEQLKGESQKKWQKDFIYPDAEIAKKRKFFPLETNFGWTGIREN